MCSGPLLEIRESGRKTVNSLLESFYPNILALIFLFCIAFDRRRSSRNILLSSDFVYIKFWWRHAKALGTSQIPFHPHSCPAFQGFLAPLSHAYLNRFCLFPPSLWRVIFADSTSFPFYPSSPQLSCRVKSVSRLSCSELLGPHQMENLNLWFKNHFNRRKELEIQNFEQVLH